MTLARPISDPLVDLVARRLRVLGQPIRLRLVDQLDRIGEANVQTLADEIVATQQNTSKHLGALWRAGIVKRRQRGRTTLYSLTNTGTFTLIAQVATDVALQLQDSATHEDQDA